MSESAGTAQEDDWNIFVSQLSTGQLKIQVDSDESVVGSEATTVVAKSEAVDEVTKSGSGSSGRTSPPEEAPAGENSKGTTKEKPKKSKKTKEKPDPSSSGNSPQVGPRVGVSVKVYLRHSVLKETEMMDISVALTCADVLKELGAKHGVFPQDYVLRTDDGEESLIDPLHTTMQFGTAVRMVPIGPVDETPAEKMTDLQASVFGGSMPAIFAEDISVEIRGGARMRNESQGSSESSRCGTPPILVEPSSPIEDYRESSGGSVKKMYFSLTRSISSKIKRQKEKELRELSPDVTLRDTFHQDIDFLTSEPGSPTIERGSMSPVSPSPPVTPTLKRTNSSGKVIEEGGSRPGSREPRPENLTKRLSFKWKNSDKKKVESIFFSSNESPPAPERRPAKPRDETKRRSFLPWLNKTGQIDRARNAKKSVKPEDYLLKGALWKRGNLIKGWKAKICVLTVEAIYFFDKEEQIAGGEWKSYVSLHEVTRINFVDEESSGRKWSFRVVSPAGETILAASSGEEAQQWVEKMTPYTKMPAATGEPEEETVVYLGRYEAGRTIGVGGYAAVKIGRDLTSERKVAIKIIKKDLNDAKAMERLEREISYLSCIDHPNIVKLYDVVEGDTTTVLIMQLLEGDTLDDFVYEAKGNCLPDFVCRFLFKKLLSAVEYIHELHVVHRDLKMENVMVSSTGELWLLDFGLSNKWVPGSFLDTYCGTLEYAAPEVVSKERPYEGGPCDIWSLGVILFSMMTGQFPFEEENVPLTLEKMQKGHQAIIYPSIVPKDVVSLFQIIFNPDPVARAAVKDISSHPWVTDEGDGNAQALAYFASLE